MPCRACNRVHWHAHGLLLLLLLLLQVSLELNGAPIGGPPQAVPPYGLAAFSVPFAPGNLTAVAWDAAEASVLGAHSTCKGPRE